MTTRHPGGRLLSALTAAVLTVGAAASIPTASAQAADAARPQPAGSQPAAAETNVRILSLNAWHQGTSVPGGVQGVLDTIEQSDANVVVLTESSVDFTKQVAQSLSTSSQTWYASPSGDSGIVSTFPVVDQKTMPYMQKAVLDTGDDEIAVYGAHLYYRYYATYLPRGYSPDTDPADGYPGWDKLPGGPVVDVDEILEVNQKSGRPEIIGDFIDEAAGDQEAGRPVFLAGDFNEPSVLDWSDDQADLFDHNGVTVPWQSTAALGEAGYVDSYRSAYPDEVTHPGFTWPSDNPAKEPKDITWAPEADERDRIDYIFHSQTPGLTLVEAGIMGPRTTIVRSERVLEDTQDNFLPSPEAWPSDHKAVVAEYVVAAEQTPKSPATIAAKFKPRQFTVGRPAKAVVRVTSTGATPTGEVVVRGKGFGANTGTLRDGRAVVKLGSPKRPGRVTLTIRYGGDDHTKRAVIIRTVRVKPRR